jgi:hypothetical protein
LAEIIKDYTDADYDYEPERGSAKAKLSDYKHVDIVPVSDPNAATMSQRVVQYQAVMQMAQMAPDIYNLPQLHRSMLDVLGIKNADKLVPLPDDMKPKDPVSENMDILKVDPVKAFLHQDHDAHIAVHMSMMQDPVMQQLIGQNPKAAQIQAALTAHVAEHAGFAYRQKIEQQLGIPLPPEDEKLPPQVELALSGMMAQAAHQVLMQSKALAAQQQAQQTAQDPLIQMQQQELQIRGQEAQTKAQKVQGDLAIAEKKLQVEAAERADKLRLEEKKLQVDAAHKADQLHLQQQGNDPRIEALRAQHQLAADQQRTQQQMSAEQMRAVMAAQQHNQALSHKQQVHEQNLKHQRAQAKARMEMMRNQPKEKPEE